MSYPPSQTHIGSPFVELQTVDSTNNYALAQIRNSPLSVRQEPIGHGTAIFAHEQVAGKGQRGKKWTSSKDESIILSIVLKPALQAVSQQFQLNICAAVSVCAFFKKYAGDDTKIKWPNDLYWKDRKAGGILIESVVRGSDQKDSQGGGWQWAVAGIGININQTHFPPGLSNAVSLKQITGKHFDPLVLAKELCTVFDHYYTRLVTEGYQQILPEYDSHFYKKNEKVKLKKDNRVFEATIKGIDSVGRLVVQHAIEEQFEHGEVQWLI